MHEEGKSREEIRLIIGRDIDLAEDVPARLVYKFETSDRAWHQFLNDIIRMALDGHRGDEEIRG
jgi:hypothetical protein